MRTKQNVTAIIYDKHGRVLSIGKNSYIKTHPLMSRLGDKVGRPQKIYLHAEVHAIIKCRNIDKAYKMVIIRINNKGETMCAKPCPICELAIKEAGIKKVEFT